MADQKLSHAKQLRREMTPQERKLWECVRSNRLNGLHFRRQQVIDGFVVDFYCHQAGLAVELDGPLHAEQSGYDGERDHWLILRGLRVLRFSHSEIDTNFALVLQRISAACQGSSAGHSPPEPIVSRD